ncbi:MAG: TVP38/TMEM64 family protein, partial [Firmicutes bacterium]|nr:TVP38/TMEM64 family protein [Bacillota bacterium]
MDPREVEKRNERKVKAAALIFLVIAVGLTFCIVYFDSLKRMGTDPAYARAWFAARQPYGALVYVLLQALQIIFVVVPGEPFELAAGYAFGAVNGSLLCLLGESIGSVAVLLAVRKFGRKIALLFFSEERLDRLKFLHYSPKRLFIFAVIFMLPASPKALLCYFAGLTDIDIHKLLIICTL